MDTTPESFGQRLARLRRRAGLSQPQLSERAGVNLTTLRHYEQHRREPMFAVAIKLARAMGISLDELAGPPGAPGPPAGKRAGPRKRK
jgi:transcriptional regulator with XRE-family HTH domain